MLDMGPETPQTVPTVHRAEGGPPALPDVSAVRRRRSGAVDTRAPITAWDALVWAYGAEHVRFAGGGTRGLERLDWRRVSATGAACDRMAAAAGGGMDGGRGSIGARASAHWDAEVIDAWVRTLPRAVYWDMVRAGETGEAPAWDAEVRPGRLVPVLGAHGRPRMLLDCGRKRVIGCLVEQEGVPAHEVEAVRGAARARYAAVAEALAALAADGGVDKRLERWCIMGIGIEAAPWEAIAAAA